MSWEDTFVRHIPSQHPAQRTVLTQYLAVKYPNLKMGQDWDSFQEDMQMANNNMKRFSMS